MSYDPKDFAANPRKYELYKTAEVARHIFTEDGADDLAPGTILRVKFHCVARNQLYRRDEPVYLCESAGKDHGYFYASTLENFVL